MFGTGRIIPRNAPRRRCGFTLVELLVVIAIIGILVALLLPAVQAAREAARRAQCINNMKQVSLAMLEFHDTYNAFPSSYSTTKYWAWGTEILPFIEYSSVYDQLPTKSSLNPADPNQLELIRTIIPDYRCPSDTMPDLNDKRAPFGASRITATSNYVGVMGSTTVLKSTYEQANGILYQNSRVRIKDITDGTTKTFLIGERDYTNHYASTWAGGTINPGNDWNSHRHLNTNPTYIGDITIQGGGLINDIQPSAFGSLHSGGAVFALADGSARYVDENIDATSDDVGETMGTYQRLGNRLDGMPVGSY